MIHSMTGFGAAQSEHDGIAYHLEIRSVNNRYFKAAVYLPEYYTFLEPDLERLVRQRVTRGSVTVRMRVRVLSADAAQELNPLAIRQYVTQIRNAIHEDPHLTIDLATLAMLPGVCQPRELSEQQREEFHRVVAGLVSQALDGMITMRATEGEMLAGDLRDQCATIRERLEAIRTRVPDVTREYRDRLLGRIRELVAGSSVSLAEEDLLKEVSIYADRSDISEEITRLTGHLEHFGECMANEEPSGRRLEFIAQEMLREANTMGSKTGDRQIGRDIVEIKSSVDRIKEQVMNVE